MYLIFQDDPDYPETIKVVDEKKEIPKGYLYIDLSEVDLRFLVLKEEKGKKVLATRQK